MRRDIFPNIPALFPIEQNGYEYKLDIHFSYRKDVLSDIERDAYKIQGRFKLCQYRDVYTNLYEIMIIEPDSPLWDEV